MQLLSMDNASLGAKEALFFSFLSRLSQPQEEYFFQEIKIKDLVQECCDFMAEKARLGPEDEKSRDRFGILLTGASEPGHHHGWLPLDPAHFFDQFIEFKKYILAG